MKTPYDKLAKIYMTEMATTSTYGKTLLKSSSQETEGKLPWDLVRSMGDVGFTMCVQIMSLS